jgi:hypothetical protein
MMLVRFLLLVIVFLLLRRVFRSLFLGGGAGRRPEARQDRAPHAAARDGQTAFQDDPRQEGPPQEIEDADYEELD